uniref:Uncharacterized protein n=1 Tax=Arundo donax TaxID=35708 RepID=A0A0A9GSN3_ARUDO
MSAPCASQPHLSVK